MRLALLALATLALTQSTERPERLTFEVASIHPSSPTQVNGTIKAGADGGGYTASNVPVKLMISLMYRIPMRQIKGAPAWLETDLYNIEAKTDKKYNLDDLHTMYQNLLIDRFHLKFHIEKVEGNAYLLTIDKAGLKLRQNDKPQDYNIPINFSGTGVMNGIRVPIPYLCWNLGQQLQQDARPVVDETGLKGNYDFTLSYLPQNIPEQFRQSLPQDVLDRPSLFDALRDQLGLKLTAGKGLVEYMVIDHIERPTDN